MSKNNQVNKRIYYALLIVAIITLPTIFYAGYYAAQAGYPSGATPVWEHPISDYAYLFWVDGSTYYAKNGSVGTIDYSGTNATTVIHSAINAMSDGETLHLKAGNYSFTNTDTYEAIVIDKPIILEGEGNGTILTYAGTFRHAMIHVRGNQSGTVIRDLCIDGKMAGTESYPFGIWVGTTDGSENTDDVIIERVTFLDLPLCGVLFDRSADNGMVLNCNFQNIGNSVTVDPCIRISQESNGTLVQGNVFVLNGQTEHAVRTYISGSTRSTGTRIIGNYITGAGYANATPICVNGMSEVIQGNTLRVTGGGSSIYVQKALYTSVIGNTILNPTSGHGISVEDSEGITLLGNTIILPLGITVSCILVSSSVDEGSHNVSITGNTLVGSNATNQAGVLISGVSGKNVTNVAVVGNNIERGYFGIFEAAYTDYNLQMGNIISNVGAGSANGIKRSAGVGGHSLGDNTLNLIY